MREPSDLYDYQRRALIHQLSHDNSMLWLDMGLGKTPITLSAIEHRMRAGQVKKVLIVGPIRVIVAVWAREARKWSHTKHLTFSVIHGTKDKRLRAMFRNVDIHLINYENLAWFSNQLKHYYLDQNRPFPYEMVVYDEVSKMKNSQAQRLKGGWRISNKGKPNETREHFQGWKKMVKYFKYRTGLTGTPAPNGYLDLFGQYLVVDDGQRFGPFISHYRDSYFQGNYNGFGYTVSDLGSKLIEEKIADITIKMDADEYLDIPPVVFNNIWVQFSEKHRKQYTEIEKDFFTKLDDGTEIELFNKNSVSNKCIQFSNGAVYKEPGQPEYVNVHDNKLDALNDILEEAAGQPVLVGYSFRFDAERIMKHFKKYKPVNLTGMPIKKLPAALKDWEDGKIKLMIGHPASMSHGIDGLQESGHILVWYGLPYSLEFYLQMIARLKRTGQTKAVMVHQIMTEDSLDLAILDSLRRKDTNEKGLKASIQRYRDNKITKEISFL